MKVSHYIITPLVAVLFLLFLTSGFARAIEPSMVKELCVVCHTADRICVNLGKNDVFWESTVKRMASNGARVPEKELAPLAIILSGQPEAVGDELGCLAGETAGANVSEKTQVPIVLALAHPLTMTLAFLLSLWVANQGINRARISLFKHKVRFNWKGHVRYGIVVMSIWFFGMIAGGFMAKLIYGSIGITGDHRTVALIMLPMILFGEGSGLYMKFKRAPRKVLPLLHGVNNLTLVLLAFMQLFTGFYLVKGLF